MIRFSPRDTVRARRAAARCAAWLLIAHGAFARPVDAYVLNRTVADARDPRNFPPNNPNPYSTCPQLNRFNTAVAGSVDRRWNTTLGTNIRTTAPANPQRETEVEQAIQESFSVWTGVAGSTLRPASLAPLMKNSTNMCSSSDARNTLCFAQSASFPTGVLAFTNTVVSDILGETFGTKQATFIGEILDADVLFNPAVPFATPPALPANLDAFDLESVLIHELGHFFGFSHSGLWRAMMYPFAVPQGQFVGDRPTMAVPDAPLADDDRTGLRVLHPDPMDTVNVGLITGRILPANPLSLPSSPPGVTGIFGAHVAAVENSTGAVIAATFAGWSCTNPGPIQFDGSYALERLPVNRGYRIYVEPLDGPVDAANIQNAAASLCRPLPGDVGWPPQFACTVPPVNTNFTTRVRP